MTFEEFMKHAADAVYMGNEDLLRGYAKEVFNERDEVHGSLARVERELDALSLKVEPLRVARDAAVQERELLKNHGFAEAARWRNAHDTMRRERDEARAEVDRLRAERRQLRARLVECRPWVGVCPIEPAKISEVCAVRDLADDTLEEVKPWNP